MRDLFMMTPPAWGGQIMDIPSKQAHRSATDLTVFGFRRSNRERVAMSGEVLQDRLSWTVADRDTVEVNINKPR